MRRHAQGGVEACSGEACSGEACLALAPAVISATLPSAWRKREAALFQVLCGRQVCVTENERWQQGLVSKFEARLCV